MFTVLYKPYGYGGACYEKTVYGVDRPTSSFLVEDWWNGFEWIPIDKCEIYIPEEEEN